MVIISKCKIAVIIVCVCGMFGCNGQSVEEENLETLRYVEQNSDYAREFARLFPEYDIDITRSGDGETVVILAHDFGNNVEILMSLSVSKSEDSSKISISNEPKISLLRSYRSQPGMGESEVGGVDWGHSLSRIEWREIVEAGGIRVKPNGAWEPLD